jgi:hypothetical protein
MDNNVEKLNVGIIFYFEDVIKTKNMGVLNV